MQKVKNNIGSETTQCGKYRVVPNALNRTSRYNYTDMNVTTKTMLKGLSANLTALRTAKGVSAREGFWMVSSQLILSLILISCGLIMQTQGILENPRKLVTGFLQNVISRYN